MPEIITCIPDDAVPWTAADLAELLASQNPNTLPNAKCLSDPTAPATPADYPRLGPRSVHNYTVLLPNIGTPQDYVLKSNWLHLPSHDVKFRPNQYDRELGRLDTLAKVRGVGELVLPHSVFISFDDPHFHNPGIIPPIIYTILSKVEGGQNLKTRLKDPDCQEVLLALAEANVDYLQGKRTGDLVLHDHTNISQYSLTGSFYDISHDMGNDPNIIGADVSILYEWVTKLPRSSRKRQLITKLKDLRQQYPDSDIED